MKKSNSHEEKAKAWRARLARAAEYSGTNREYCKAEGLSIHTFAYWKHKLAEKRESEVFIPQPFARVEVESPAVQPSNNSGLPDPRWVAEVILHLQRGLR